MSFVPLRVFGGQVVDPPAVMWSESGVTGLEDVVAVVVVAVELLDWIVC